MPHRPFRALKNRAMAGPQICGAAAVVRSSLSLSDDELCVYDLCRQLTALVRKTNLKHLALNGLTYHRKRQLHARERTRDSLTTTSRVSGGRDGVRSGCPEAHNSAHSGDTGPTRRFGIVLHRASRS